MVPTPTFQTLPTFGTSASVVKPVDATYDGGFLPGQLFPAEYENWLMNYITANSNTNQTTVLSILAELTTILTAASITPSAGLTTQVYTALNNLYASVGALSTETTNRQNADTTLQNNINSEASTRASADTTLQNNINNSGISVSSTVSGAVSLPNLNINQTTMLVYRTSGSVTLSVANGTGTISGFSFDNFSGNPITFMSISPGASFGPYPDGTTVFFIIGRVS